MMNGRPNSEQEKAGGQPGDFIATKLKHNIEFATKRHAEKCFSTSRALYAIHDHSLYKATAADGAVVFFAGAWGMFRELKNLEAVAAFFAMIGGKV